ncbi:MAG: hypothetical protein FWG05_00955 [Kiritimatiellaeota bacterium]|nr:hypothetical protein [Kiritimatiellota bacterium]
MREIKTLQPYNCFLSILFGLFALVYYGAFAFMEFQYGYISALLTGGGSIGGGLAGVILSISGFFGLFLVYIAVHKGKKGFTHPERLYMKNANENYKRRLLVELNEKREPTHHEKIFIETILKAINLDKQNDIARVICKYPVRK